MAPGSAWQSGAPFLASFFRGLLVPVVVVLVVLVAVLVGNMA